jgi:hypothetical protein
MEMDREAMMLHVIQPSRVRAIQLGQRGRAGLDGEILRLGSGLRGQGGNGMDGTGIGSPLPALISFLSARLDGDEKGFYSL